MIQIENLYKSYEKHTALKDVSLNIKKGSIFGLLGPNGAGKTSLIRILTQITEADSGKISFNGQALSAHHLLKMGYLPEERGLYKKMTVKDQLLFFAELKGMSVSQAKQNLKYWVDQFDIKTWLPKKVEELSKGMQQKVQFIATVAHEPDLIILDEPFSGFDPINAQILTEQIIRLKNNGATIIFSTHRMDSVELLCDHIALINRSEKILDGAVDEIRNKFRKNQYELLYDGVLPEQHALFQIQTLAKTESGGKCLLNLNESIPPNVLIKALLDLNIQIKSFGEKLPGMEEIFIDAVQQKNETNAHA